MRTFITEVSLDTKSRHEIELLGPANSAVQHQINGKLHLVVLKPVQLKQLSVTFMGAG